MTLTRFAPSPTGLLHLGNLRAAFFNFAIARRTGGRFLLRIDDTDAERSEERFVEAIRDDLRWLGLDWDEEVRQSGRLDRYGAAAERLKTSGRLYPCWETPKELDLKRKVLLQRGRPPVYDRAALTLSEEEKARLAAERPPHWRFKLDRERVEWTDGILGAQSVDAASVSDPVLIREDGQVLYTLASAVDDAEFGVTDVVRGADHVTNSAAQIQILRALGAEEPRFAHHSLLTLPGGAKLSKREDDLSLRRLRDEGREPMALLSLIARLGSSQPVEPCTDLARVVYGFDLASFGAAPTWLDPEDLAQLSTRILHATSFAQAAPRLAAMGIEGQDAEPFWTAVGGNLERMDEAGEWWAICRDGVAPFVAPEDADFVVQALGALPPRPWDGRTWTAWTDAL